MDFICLPILLFTGLILVSILTGFFTARLGIPLILLFILIGMVLGADNPPFLTQKLLTAQNVFFLGSVALALILFDSGFNTQITDFKLVAAPASLLASLGVCLGALLLTPIVMILLNVSFIGGLLLSSIIGSTDAAAVFFLLRSRGLYLKNRVKSTLEVESGANDPMAIFLTFACLALLEQNVVSTNGDFSFFVVSLLEQAGIGAVGGYILYIVMKHVLTRFDLEQALFPLFVLSFVMAGFALITWIGGSGYLALYLCGVLIGNTPIKAYTTLLKFQQTVAWLCQIMMFTVLGLFVQIDELPGVIWDAVVLSFVLMFIARPVMIFGLLSLFKKYSFHEKLFISFVGLRGATSILLALTPLVFGLSFGETYFNIVFVMVILSLSVQGFFIPFVARQCHVLASSQTVPPERTSIDLPGLIQSNLIVYELGPYSAVLQGQCLPQWAQPLLLKRDDVVYQPNNMPTLKENDKVYVFAPNMQRMPLLDRLYGNWKSSDKLRIFGDFPIAPTTTFQQLKNMYGVEIDESLYSTTIAEYIRKTFPESDVGDRFAFGAVEIIIRAQEYGQITALGIDIDATKRQNKINVPSLQI